MKELLSHNDLLKHFETNKRVYLLLYKSGSTQSECALKTLAELDNKPENLYLADVSKVRDIHPIYGIDTVPTLLIFEDKELKNVIKGCQSKQYYISLFEGSFSSILGENAPKKKRVIVYSTPTCSWCNTLKSYLHKNGISFIDIDVSRDQKAAEELVRRTGQQGVPQTDIDGHIVVGFDKAKIDTLLGITAN